MLTVATQFALHGDPRPVAPAEASYQSSEFHQVGDKEQRTPRTHDDLRIRRNEVRPLRWNGANSLGINLQQQPLAVPVVPRADAGELLPAERVERMRHAHKTRRNGGSICIPD
jgi:hypothetical protein